MHTIFDMLVSRFFELYICDNIKIATSFASYPQLLSIRDWYDIYFFIASKTTFIKLIHWCRTGNGMHNHIKTYDLYFSCSSTWYTPNKLYFFHCMSCWFAWIILYCLCFLIYIYVYVCICVIYIFINFIMSIIPTLYFFCRFFYLNKILPYEKKSP